MSEVGSKNELKAHRVGQGQVLNSIYGHFVGGGWLLILFVFVVEEKVIARGAAIGRVIYILDGGRYRNV